VHLDPEGSVSPLYEPGPSITLVKAPDEQAVAWGSPVTFTISVTNTGDVDLADVSVSDPLAPDCAREIGALAMGEGFHYDCGIEWVTKGMTNEATATGSPPESGPVSDTDTAVVYVEATEYQKYMPIIRRAR
jgi:uncharacterized repeat protein (TIGR01451 family)